MPWAVFDAGRVALRALGVQVVRRVVEVQGVLREGPREGPREGLREGLRDPAKVSDPVRSRTVS